ncbi:tetratricopeptide repeat protein [Zeaxanthinibacter enoshimensis]|uniref:Tetratricopeptide repeat protein n=1 Tax=Zeaxanthinibacter enoshimensis TaxID=392009 RepID=A0A4R6TM56_9FLAO|nr:tetratricopeptide repeat protein [Zeaxanthinibacter enoshimensis]TDQ32504.1 tetratricopeptide repeat protein [Zeaxanthinibacter enoshimensis]
MRFLLLLISLLLIQVGTAQEDFLAKQYFNEGKFEKALIFYKKLVEKNSRRTDYAEGLIATYQQLERYEEAENFLLELIRTGPPYPTMYIDLGYNYRLQEKHDEAKRYFDKALETIEKNPNYGYGIGLRFQRYTMLDHALVAYNRAMELNPQLDYKFQMARIYGEQGKIEDMFGAYLDIVAKGRAAKTNVLRNVEEFITSDGDNENNQVLKKLLLKRAQQEPDILWNELLSWLFVQQEQYRSAFSQERAIYKRAEGSTLERLEGLGRLALEKEAKEEAREIFEYIEKNSKDPVGILNARLFLIEIALEDADPKQLDAIEQQFEALQSTYGYQGQTLQLQVAYSNFLAFRRDKPRDAIAILKNCLEIPMAKYAQAYVKMALADILVFDRRFNEALIQYSQVQKGLKNDVMGQEARFKVAQTSFYKGDFEWALTQLEVLRGSTSQLIANDAMQLSLLISDNSLEDSTQTALKKYARADLLAYQNKDPEAIALLDEILTQHKGESIEDEALFKQAELLEKAGSYDAARFNYEKIIEFYGIDILADDAIYALAELYRTHFNKPEIAMTLYEKIIYNHQDSYHFPEARKKFRMLRGDPVN